MGEQLDIFSTTTLELEEDDEAGIFSTTDASRRVLKTYAFRYIPIPSILFILFINNTLSSIIKIADCIMYTHFYLC